ncbi:hypothetical protein EYR40_006927 [Pleurotus pulmonarius]|nr:hypothetical protein EYR36_003793 [Pleurotus pulmonarius]KAF4598568.1 hypothetical protein EYR38_006972 [Pleurotus pulmonarius]KAF4599825.1 hypothetical protein EYR40_006927 [Pleurotus pulmonarius]
MSPEVTAARKKRTTEANPAPEGDHRKRRRNRTTQSCLNCHTSKRMCDRKRPACARCTQLGLTGLCVYEVDDPSQRSDTQDESARLLKRVAELEGVIRELKNKPHPRWVHATAAPSEDFDRWHSRATARLGDSSELPSNASSPPSSSSSDGGDSSSSMSHAPSLSNVYPTPHLSQDHTYYSSPGSTPSPSTLTPTEEFSRPLVSIAGHDVPHDFDLTSWFSSYPGIMGCDDGTYGALSKERDDSSFIKQQSGHCGCLHEPANYNVVLELSLRLRKAAEVLARSPSHRMGSNCVLQHRISELDTFATNTLGNIAIPPEDLPTSIPTPERPHPDALAANVMTSNVYPNCRPAASSSLSPNPLHSLRTWDMLPVTEAPPDDSFMSWEPPRRG